MPSASTPRSPIFEYERIQVRQQPDDVSCGPACLQGIYEHYGLTLSLEEVMASVRSLDHGGTLAVLLGLDALARGFSVTLFTNNLEVFDPTWFVEGGGPLLPLLEEQLRYKTEPRLVAAAEAYIEFLEHGGRVLHEELTPDLLARIVRRGAPPITGLSSTYLYGCEREFWEGRRSIYDDIRGEPVGHFVVLSGVNEETGDFRISDPATDNPRHRSGTYWVTPHRLIGAIFLGVTTYDGTLLLIEPGGDDEAGSRDAAAPGSV